MSQLYAQSSVHMKSLNPTLYLGLMEYYMYHVLSSVNNPTQWKIRSDTLYKNISYPALSDATQDLNVLLMSSSDKIQTSIPDIPLNTGIKNWMKNIQTGQGHLDAIIINSSVHIKYPRTDDNETQKRGIFEYFIGTLMNKLRKKMPHFVYTLGAFKCGISPGTTSAQFCANQEHTVYHLVQEKIEGKTLDSWLQKNPDSLTFYTIILQLVFALAKAQDKNGFVHNALYTSNVILRPSDIGTVTFQFESQVYKMATGKEIPTIIDYSSARATHKGFGLCYLSNPTIFTPGKDLCKLVMSALARLNSKPIYTEVSWINEFFHNIYDVSSGSYDDLLSRYHNFELVDDNPLASLTPMDFINWFRGRAGETFNKLVTVTAREIKELHLTNIKPKQEVERDLAIIPSGAIKSFALAAYEIKYIPTEQENKYDIELTSHYSNIITSKSTKIYLVNYNFPLSRQYDEETRVNYIDILSKLQYDYRIVSNYITFLRYAKTNENVISSFSSATSNAFTEKDKLRHNINVISNLPLYRLYQVATANELNSVNGQVIIVYQDLYDAANWIKQLYPACTSYLDSTFLPKTEIVKLGLNVRLVDLPVRGINDEYYPPCTLEQFKQLIYHKKDVLDLVTKTFFGPSKDKAKMIEPIISQVEKDDIQIFMDLRQFHTPGPQFDRGAGKARDVNKLLGSISSKLNNRGNFASYLDFGGGDGNISSAVAKILKINKADAYSADVEKWYSTSRARDHSNITYLTLKENQMINLPDNSIDIVTCFQVLHHIKNIDFVLNELKRICKYTLVIREHDCKTDGQRMIIDLEHSLFELSLENIPNIKFLNNYEAWYRSKEEWINILQKYGFNIIHSTEPYGPTRYWYGVYNKVK